MRPAFDYYSTICLEVKWSNVDLQFDYFVRVWPGLPVAP